MSWKKAKPAYLPDYSASEEENKWHTYCIENGIIISPMGINGNIKEWKIGVAFSGRHKQVHKSPTVYTKDNIWQETFLMMKYYYDKRTR